MTTPDMAELARAAAAHARPAAIPTPDVDQDAFLEVLLRLGDTTLILGHRVSEWCGHAPALEEDIALANVALDLIGQTRMWLGLAAEVEGRGARRMTSPICATPGTSATCSSSSGRTAISGIR